jgi:hypothetical protein
MFDILGVWPKSKVDLDEDGSVDRAEWAVFIAALRNQRIVYLKQYMLIKRHWCVRRQRTCGCEIAEGRKACGQARERVREKMRENDCFMCD